MPIDKNLLNKIASGVTEPTEPKEPAEPTEPAESAAPTEAAPTEPKEPTEAAEAAAPTEADEADGKERSAFFEYLNSLVQPAEPAPAASVEPAPAAPAAAADGFEPASVDFTVLVDPTEENQKKFQSSFAAAQQQVYEKAVQDTLQKVYPVIQSVSMQMTAWGNAALQFKMKNTDIAEAMPFIGQQATRIAAAHPDWSPEKVYNEAGTVTRKALKFAAQQQQNAKNPAKKPKFAPTPGTHNREQSSATTNPAKESMRKLLRWDEPQEVSKFVKA